MELTAVRTLPSPLDSRRLRLEGDVTYDDRPGEVESYWFDLDAQYGGDLSRSGNPWLACLLPLAVTLGQPLRLCLPVDRVLAGNVDRLMQIWARWYPGLKAVPVHAEPEETRRETASEVASLFSGGVDSFHAVLRNAEENDREAFPEIRRLLCVWGFDIPLSAPDQFSRLRSRLSEAARDLGKEFLDVGTNLRETRFRSARWGRLSHGCALAAVGLVLGRRFDTIYFASTNPKGLLVPWGSHPETDTLLSTSVTRIIHYGTDVGRSEKTEYISRSDVAMRSLHVCFQSGSAENCGACRKCYLTMLSLDVIGALSRCRTFPQEPLDLRKVRRIYTEHAANDQIFRDLADRAAAVGRSDIASAVHRCLRRSRRVARLLSVLQLFSEKRFLWRVSKWLQPIVLAGTIR